MSHNQQAIAEIKSHLREMEGAFRRRGSKWAPVVRYVLENGEAFKIAADSFSGRRMMKKACYRNATNHVLAHPELAYVEGYVHLGWAIIEHAWVARSDGSVKDPTLSPEGSTPLAYFGVAFDSKTLAKQLCKQKRDGLLNPIEGIFANVETSPGEPLLAEEAKK